MGRSTTVKGVARVEGRERPGHLQELSHAGSRCRGPVARGRVRVHEPARRPHRQGDVLRALLPHLDRLVSQEMLSVVPTEGDDVFVMYEYELKTGGRHRNVEVLTVRDDRIIETQVFFGGPVR